MLGRYSSIDGGGFEEDFAGLECHLARQLCGLAHVVPGAV